MKLAEALVGILIFPLTCDAHHSRVEFSDEVIELEGELVNIIWKNPHVAFALESRGENGELERWSIEVFAGPVMLERAGVSAELFQTGLAVRVAGQPSSLRPLRLLGTHILLPDGTEAVLGRRFDPMWSEKFVGGAKAYALDESDVVDAASEDRGLFRTWTLADGSGPTRRTLPFNEAALAILAEVDPTNTPITRCEPPGMPVPMMQPAPYEFIDDGPVITLHNPYFDTYRKIVMENPGDPDDQPLSPLGYSVGHWEDGDLVVETSRINWFTHDIRGRPQSEQVRISERFSLSSDQAELHYFMEIFDPVYMNEPAIFERTWVASGEALLPWECQVF